MTEEEIKDELMFGIIKHMISGVSKKAFLEDTASEELNEAYDSGELTNDMFYSVMKDLETCLWEFYNES